MDNIQEISTLKLEVEALKQAIRKHRDQKGDDRCWLDDQELYQVLNEGPAETSLPSKEEFLTNCAKFHATRQAPGALPVIGQEVGRWVSAEELKSFIQLKWTECNLPWVVELDLSTRPPCPDLSEREREKFGTTIEESRAALKYTGRGSYEEWEANASPEDIAAIETHRKLVGKISRWSDTQPEWIEHKKQCQKWADKENSKSFSRTGPLTGVVVEFTDGTFDLIGSFSWDDEMDNKIVKRYAVLDQIVEMLMRC